MSQLVIAKDLKMTSREIAELVGSNHSDVKRSAERLSVAGVLTQPLAESKFEHRGNTYTEYFFGKRDSLVLVARLSPEFTAAVVDRWQELEGDVQHAAASALVDKVQAGILLVEAGAKILNLSSSSKLGAMHKLEQVAGIPGLFPAYAIDAPVGAIDGSSRSTKPLTDILKKNGISMSARVANIRLEEAGIIEHKERRSSAGKTKFFWNVTNAGLAYGKNVTSPSNPRETQPHWYESKSADLVKIITGGDE